MLILSSKGDSSENSKKMQMHVNVFRKESNGFVKLTGTNISQRND